MGAAVKIGDMRRELKRLHGLTREQVVSNLTYLISQGWVDKQLHDRVVPNNGGRHIPTSTPYFVMTASGIDKIEGPSEYTPRDRFAGIVNISTSGQNVVTVGDGNQVYAKFMEQGEALSALADAIKHNAELSANVKMDAIADVDTIQSQLARSQPNSNVIKTAWKTIEPLAKVASLSNLVIAAAQKLSDFV